MKTLTEILNSTPVFIGFENTEDVLNKFGPVNNFTGKILFAEYDTPPYEGYAQVLFEQGGKLYEVYGSHCSCYGLEGQWLPSEVTYPLLQLYYQQGNKMYNSFLTKIQ